jgi:hypothetical protein
VEQLLPGCFYRLIPMAIGTINTKIKPHPANAESYAQQGRTKKA